MYTQIVSGILTQEDEVLLCLRKNTEVYDGYWSFPGGRREDSESVSNAVVRELKEEIGVTVDVNSNPIILREDEHNRKHYIFHFKEWSGSPVNLEPELCAEIKWFKYDDMPAKIMPICLEILGLIKELKPNKSLNRGS